MGNLAVDTDLVEVAPIGRRHLDSNDWIAPSIDVSCEFHRPGTGDDWFLLQPRAPTPATASSRATSRCGTTAASSSRAASAICCAAASADPVAR